MILSLFSWVRVRWMTFETILRTGSNCHGVVVELSCVGGVQSHVCLKIWWILRQRLHSHLALQTQQYGSDMVTGQCCEWCILLGTPELNWIFKIMSLATYRSYCPRFLRLRRRVFLLMITSLPIVGVQYQQVVQIRIVLLCRYQTSCLCRIVY